MRAHPHHNPIRKWWNGGRMHKNETAILRRSEMFLRHWGRKVKKSRLASSIKTQRRRLNAARSRFHR